MAETESAEGYVENEDFVPNPTDLYGTYNTSGVGASDDPATVSPIFAQDKAASAQRFLDALDPDNPYPKDRIIFPDPVPVVSADNDALEAEVKEQAQAAVDAAKEAGTPVPPPTGEGDSGSGDSGSGDSGSGGDQPVAAKKTTASKK